jgi:cell division protein DivIC
MKKILQHLSRFKYVYTLLAFGLWMIFFDQNRILNQISLQKSLRGLLKQKNFYETEIKKNQKQSNDLVYDSVFMEKYAREKYLLKKDNEVIYLIVKEE